LCNIEVCAAVFGNANQSFLAVLLVGSWLRASVGLYIDNWLFVKREKRPTDVVEVMKFVHDTTSFVFGA